MALSIDPDLIYEFPEPGQEIPYDNICCVTSDIEMQVLYSAYMQGVFPWFDEDSGEPVVWYSPNPRFCLQMKELHVPKSIDKFLKSTPYKYTMDRDFENVILNCRNMNRKDQEGTWIGQKIIDSYLEFHYQGYAHSVEVWHDGNLVGGLYGVLLGSVFCGESMFTIESDSAKSAFVIFARAFEKCGGMLIDSQVYTDNIARYGAKNISRDAFLRLEREYLPKKLKQDLKAVFEADARIIEENSARRRSCL